MSRGCRVRRRAPSSGGAAVPVPSPWSKVSAGSRDGLAVTGFADFDVAPGSIRGVMLSPKNVRRLLLGHEASLGSPRTGAPRRAVTGQQVSAARARAAPGR